MSEEVKIEVGKRVGRVNGTDVLVIAGPDDNGRYLVHDTEMAAMFTIGASLLRPLLPAATALDKTKAPSPYVPKAGERVRVIERHKSDAHKAWCAPGAEFVVKEARRGDSKVVPDGLAVVLCVGLGTGAWLKVEPAALESQPSPDTIGSVDAATREDAGEAPSDAAPRNSTQPVVSGSLCRDCLAPCAVNEAGLCVYCEKRPVLATKESNIDARISLAKQQARAQLDAKMSRRYPYAESSGVFATATWESDS